MKVLTVGGAMMDTIAVIESKRIERLTLHHADSSFLLLEEGRKTEAEDVSTHPGGGAVNAAVAMARLGLDVAVLAKVGKDLRAAAILARLAQEGVSDRWIVRDEHAPTGASVLLSSHERNAAVFTFRGANTHLEVAGSSRRGICGRCRLHRQSEQSIRRLLSDDRQSRSRSPCPRGGQPRAAPAIGPRAGFSRIYFRHRHSRAQSRRSRSSGAESRQPICRGRSDPRSRPRRGDARPGGARVGGWRVRDGDCSRTFARSPGSVPNTWSSPTARGALASDQPRKFCSCRRSRRRLPARPAPAMLSPPPLSHLSRSAARSMNRCVRRRSNSASVVGHIDTQTGLLHRNELDQQLAAIEQPMAIRKWAV